MRYLRLPLFPILLGIYPIIFVYAYNKQHFMIDVIVLPVVVSLLFVLLGFAVFYAVMKSAQKAAFMVAICCGTVILYNPIFLWVQNTRIPHLLSIGPGKLVLSSALLTLLVSFVVLIRTRVSLSRLTIIMNVFAATLVLMPVVIILNYRLLPNQISSSPDRPQELLTFDQATIDAATLPDIYHIVLDGYGRWDTYRDYYGFGNDKLRNFFDENGFLVSDVSRSNYAQTALTFASMLNANYLQELLGNLHAGAETDDRTPLYRLIRMNAVFSSLKKAGYQVQVFESGYDGTDFRVTPTRTLGPNNSKFTNFEFLDEFQSELLNRTPLPDLLDFLGNGSLGKAAMQRARIDYAFDNIGKAWTLDDGNGGESMPVYTLVHILGPHHPHLYNADGTPFDGTEGNTGDACRIIGERGMSAKTYRERHVNYMTYLNQRLMQAIERILQTQRRKTVILVSSDHGPRSNCDASNLMKPDYLRERTANLLAIYAPDMAEPTQFLNATPVNYYRLLFNGYLGAKLPLLPDHVYYSSFDKPFAFFDVTDATAPNE